MKIGDLVYVPYFGDYGIIVRKEPDDDAWHVFYPCGFDSYEYEEYLELANEA